MTHSGTVKGQIYWFFYTFLFFSLQSRLNWLRLFSYSSGCTLSRGFQSAWFISYAWPELETFLIQLTWQQPFSWASVAWQTPGSMASDTVSFVTKSDGCCAWKNAWQTLRDKQVIDNESLFWTMKKVKEGSKNSINRTPPKSYRTEISFEQLGPDD